MNFIPHLYFPVARTTVKLATVLQFWSTIAHSCNLITSNISENVNSYMFRTVLVHR